jgi:hypothetical protein
MVGVSIWVQKRQELGRLRPLVQRLVPWLVPWLGLRLVRWLVRWLVELQALRRLRLGCCSIPQYLDHLDHLAHLD